MPKKENWLIKTIVGGLITVVILGLIVWGIQMGTTERPLVSYKLQECHSTIGSKYSSNQPSQMVSLGISNSGKTDASVLLHFYGENITILNETKRPYSTINKTDVYVRFTTPKESSYYFGETVSFIVDKDVKGFIFNYEVIKNPDQTISGTIDKFFGEIKGFYPTTCNYIIGQNSEYLLQE